MSITEIFNDLNKSFEYQHNLKNLNSIDKTQFIGFPKPKPKPKFKIIMEIQLKPFEKPIKMFTELPKKPYNPKRVFGFWNNSNYTKPITKEFILPSIDKLIEIQEKPIEIKSSPVKQELDIFELNLDFSFLENINQEYSNNDLILMLNYNNSNNRLFDIINTYDKYVSNHNDKFEILKEVYKLTHKRMIKDNKLSQWIENYPNLIDNKIKAIKNKIKKKNKDPKRSKKAIKQYQTSELRLKTLVQMIESKGYYNPNLDEIRNRMIELKTSKNLDIVNEIIENLDDLNNDHDMIEFDENKQFQEYIKECEMRYKDHE